MKVRIISASFSILVGILILAPLSVFAQEFVALTSLPGLKEAESSQNLSVFLNSLYKICIGAAAVLAVFQIMRAGILFMTNKGSISENEQARSLIQGSVFGLILVLSPVIVFTIINPQILELKLSTEPLKSDFSGDFDGTTEDDPLVTNNGSNGKLMRATFHSTNAKAQEWLVKFCPLREQLEPPVPIEVAEMVHHYKRDISEVTCPPDIQGTSDCRADGKTTVAVCEAHSENFQVFRADTPMNMSGLPWGDDEWNPIPGNDATFHDAFVSICEADGGNRNLEVNIAGTGCGDEEVAAIGEGKWKCRGAILVCEADRPDDRE